MVATLNGKPRFRTLADVLERVGGVAPERILNSPEPGTATPDDLLNPAVTGNRVCELIDGILVEKVMGFTEEYLGARLIALLYRYLDEHNIGAVSGGQGAVMVGDTLYRVPDVTFIRWDSMDDPTKLDRRLSFLDDVPDLVVEVLSPGNTAKEMTIKLTEYEKVGVRLVWYVDPEAKTVTVYPKGKVRGSKVLTEADTLDGGKVLPGFALPVREIFASRLPANLPKKPKKKRK